MEAATMSENCWFCILVKCKRAITILCTFGSGCFDPSIDHIKCNGLQQHPWIISRSARHGSLLCSRSFTGLQNGGQDVCPSEAWDSVLSSLSMLAESSSPRLWAPHSWGSSVPAGISHHDCPTNASRPAPPLRPGVCFQGLH